MRENKFKFLMENGEVTEPYYLKELIDSDAYIDVESEYSSKIKQELQYAGFNLKDREIYEGDIIKARKDFLYEVKFEDGAFCLYHLNKYDGMEQIKWGLLYRLFASDMEDILNQGEIIGNIYENPELLDNK